MTNPNLKLKEPTAGEDAEQHYKKKIRDLESVNEALKIKLVRDPKEQIEIVGVPEEHILGHAFHLYHLTSPDKTVSFEFQHNVCGRSIYSEGTVDAMLFLAKKIRAKAEKRIYNMIDVLREGNMR